jgi:hypothetical protein
MRSIIDLTRRFERQALVRPNVTHYLWRFAANGVRTGRAIVTPPAFGDTGAIARDLTDRPPRQSSDTRSGDCPSGRPGRQGRNGGTNRPCSDARSDSVGPRGG